MISDDLAIQLHDKATKGEILTPTQQAQLEARYATQDAAEQEHLILSEPTLNPSQIQNQIGISLSQIHQITERIQAVTSENQRLRGEIHQLQKQVAKHLHPV